VATAWQARAAGGRFPFYLFAGGGWSLEHIHPQNPDDTTDYPNRLETLQEMARYFERKNASDDKSQTVHPLVQLIQDTLALPATAKEEFNGQFIARRREYLKLFSDIDSSADRNNLQLHGLENMALLSGSHNSALGNDSFLEKRTKILALSQKGDTFVPPATRDVFLKAHTVDLRDEALPEMIKGESRADWVKANGQPSADLSCWLAPDRARYLQAMRQSILQFLAFPAFR
jgi:hypothetical protein